MHNYNYSLRQCLSYLWLLACLYASGLGPACFLGVCMPSWYINTLYAAYLEAILQRPLGVLLHYIIYVTTVCVHECWMHTEGHTTSAVCPPIERTSLPSCMSHSFTRPSPPPLTTLPPSPPSSPSQTPSQQLTTANINKISLSSYSSNKYTHGLGLVKQLENIRRKLRI